MKLNLLILNYIAYRKSIGEKFRSNEVSLKAFSKHMGDGIDIKNVSTKKVQDFLYGNAPVTRTWFGKYSALKGFYEYAIARKFAVLSPLPTILPKRPPIFIPYIYTRAELQRLFKTAFTYQRNWRHMEPYMVSKLLLVLYATGLRLGEALALTMKDVNIFQSVITVRQTKFYKSRLVPFGCQLKTEIIKYVKWRKKRKFSQGEDSSFFYGKENEALKMATVEKVFRQICKHAKILRTDGSRYQPRLHDLRHTFSVHRLLSWYQENDDVQQLLPVLSVYLGHSCISSTSVYLKMTNDLLQEAGKKFEKYVKGET